MFSLDADDGERNKHFLNFGLYISTLACLALGMIFALVSGILALYNTYRTPIQPFLSVYGLYFWNGISGKKKNATFYYLLRSSFFNLSHL